MPRHRERELAPSLAAALSALGVAPGATAALVPPELARELGPVVAAAERPEVELLVVDAERADLERVLEAHRDRLVEGALVVVRARVRGDGVLGGLRGPRALADLTELLLELPLGAIGVVDIRGLFGATLVWARVRALA